MAEFEITERTEPFTLDEVFDFIDDTNIGKADAHELKSRIADMVQAERDKAIDEFADKMKELIYKWIDKGVIAVGCIDEIAEQMKGEQNE